MATNGPASDGGAQVTEISIDLLDGVDRSEPTGADGSGEDGRPAEARVSIPHGRSQAVRATVTSTDGGRWRCDFHVDPASVPVSRAPAEESAVHVGEVSEWVAPVLNVIEALVTEAGC